MSGYELRRDGGDPTIGRKPRGYVVEGIPNPKDAPLASHRDGGNVKRLYSVTVEATADAIVGAGVATAEETCQALDDLDRYLRWPDALVVDPRTFRVWAAHAPRDGR